MMKNDVKTLLAKECIAKKYLTLGIELRFLEPDRTRAVLRCNLVLESLFSSQAWVPESEGIQSWSL